MIEYIFFSFEIFLAEAPVCQLKTHFNSSNTLNILSKFRLHLKEQLAGDCSTEDWCAGTGLLLELPESWTSFIYYFYILGSKRTTRSGG